MLGGAQNPPGAPGRARPGPGARVLLEPALQTRDVIPRDLQNPGISMMNPLGKLRKRPLFDAPTSQILDFRVFTRKPGFRSWDRQNHVFFSDFLRNRQNHKICLGQKCVGWGVRGVNVCCVTEGPKPCAGPSHEPFQRKTAIPGTYFESIHKPIPNKTVVPEHRMVGGGSMVSMYVATPKDQDGMRDYSTNHFDAKVPSGDAF